MNKHPMATVDLAICALGHSVFPLLIFGISWFIARWLWLLEDIAPQWGTPLFWASGITKYAIFRLASEPPETRPPDVSPQIPPLTKFHLAIRMGLATLYRIVLSVILGIAGKPDFAHWLTEAAAGKAAVVAPFLTVALPAAIIVFALFHYSRLYRTYCQEHLHAESSS